MSLRIRNARTNASFDAYLVSLLSARSSMLPRPVVAVTAVLLTISSHTIAFAWTEKQRNAIEKLSGAIFLTELCPTAELNEALFDLSIRLLDLDNGRSIKEIVTLTLSKLEEIRSDPDLGTELVCAAAQFLYGENGYNADNLIIFSD